MIQNFFSHGISILEFMKLPIRANAFSGKFVFMKISPFPRSLLLRQRLQYDIEKGLLLKLDSFLQIQLGTVFRGLSRVPDEEVMNLYRNRFIPIAYVEGKFPLVCRMLVQKRLQRTFVSPSFLICR
jgi:5' nucleotidase family